MIKKKKIKIKKKQKKKLKKKKNENIVCNNFEWDFDFTQKIGFDNLHEMLVCFLGK